MSPEEELKELLRVTQKYQAELIVKMRETDEALRRYAASSRPFESADIKESLKQMRERARELIAPLVPHFGPGDSGTAKPRNQTDEQSLMGLTLRDYLAAAALQGLLSSNRATEPNDKLATDAYNHADAMLRARKPPDSSFRDEPVT
jgi:hypothetical protein